MFWFLSCDFMPVNCEKSACEVWTVTILPTVYSDMEEKRNQALPETQDYSQLSEDESQSLYDTPTTTSLPPPWAKLLYLIDQRITFGKRSFALVCRSKWRPNVFILDLRQNFAHFGREAATDENVDVFIFSPSICPEKHVEKISKCHFKIERLTSESSSSLDPAVLTCHGRNGLYINGNKLKADDQQILAHGDVIKLSKSVEIFKFYYQQTPPELDTFPQACLQKYFIGAQIGSGGCGIVRLVHNLRTMEKFAMKVIKKETNPMIKSRYIDNEKILNEVSKKSMF